MKINKSKFLSLVLLFSLVFNSLAIATDSDNSTKHDYEVTIGEYKYFSDKVDGYKLKKVALKETEATVEEITTSGGAIHLVTNYNESDPKDEDKYFYYCLNEDASNIFKFDIASNRSSKIEITNIAYIPTLKSMISEMVVTKNSSGKDVIFFIEPSPDSEEGLLCQLNMTNDNEATLNVDFKYDKYGYETDVDTGIVVAKDIYIKDGFLHFLNFIDDSRDDLRAIPGKLDINGTKITDIDLNSIEIKRKSSSGNLEEITNGVLNIHKGDEVTLVAYMNPEDYMNPETYKDLTWKAQGNKNSDGKEILKDLKPSIDSTEYSFKVSEEASIGDISNIVVFDKISNKLASINIVVEDKKNPLKEIKLNTSSLQEILVLEKGEHLEIPIIFIGEDASKNITNINEIKNKLKASSNEYIGTEIIPDKDNNKLLKITANKITPEGSGSKAEITIDIEEYKNIKIESPSIIVKEIIKPNIKIQPVGLSGEVDTTKPIDLVQGKILDFELMIEKDGKFEKISDSEAEKIAWSKQSIDNKELISMDPVKGIKTTVTALETGATSLTATYKYDGEKTVDCKIDLTVIANEYANHDKWPDKDLPTTVDSNKIWTINFSQPINEDTVNSRTIFIKKRLGPNSEVLYDDTITYIGDNNKSIKVKPIIPYSSGDYFLYIENIQNTNGDKIKNNIKMKFTVK